MDVTVASELWFFWLSFFFLAGLAVVVPLLLVGYYMKVLRPKRQGRSAQ